MKESVEPDEGAQDFSAEVKKVGGIVEFGHYEQDNNLENGSESIEWIVLDVQDGKSLLISKYGLDNLPYDSGHSDITWEYSSLRSWLYNDFWTTAFTASEQKAILATYNDNRKSQSNPGWNTDGGATTYDRVFLLSYMEADIYFYSNEARQCEPTVYAVVQGSYTNMEGCCCWWLRSPGGARHYAAVTRPDGSLGYNNKIQDDNIAIRPALWISHDKYTETLGEAEVAEHQRRLQIASQKLREELASVGGAIVTFGTYEQDNDFENGPEAIDWIVLDVQDGKALLISRYGLDCQPYNETRKTVTWEISTLRTWLNKDFLSSAFSEAENNSIIETSVDNSRVSGIGWSWNTDWEPDTQDKVFLLSYSEAKEYFASDEERICQPTEYAKSQGAYSYNDNCWWWLRSIRTISSVSYAQGEAAGVKINGTLGDSDDVDYSYGTVRPAIWIDLTPDPLT